MIHLQTVKGKSYQLRNQIIPTLIFVCFFFLTKATAIQKQSVKNAEIVFFTYVHSEFRLDKPCKLCFYNSDKINVLDFWKQLFTPQLLSISVIFLFLSFLFFFLLMSLLFLLFIKKMMELYVYQRELWGGPLYFHLCC